MLPVPFGSMGSRVIMGLVAVRVEVAQFQGL